MQTSVVTAPMSDSADGVFRVNSRSAVLALCAAITSAKISE
jgi:hypothetical protein